MTTIVKIDPISPESDKIALAANVIKEGGTVAFPTETVYGLGADGFNREACRRIFDIKGRPADNPLILHIPNLSWLSRVSTEHRENILQFAKKVWPGPVTLTLRRAASVPDIVTAGLDTVAIRCPAHKIALSLIEQSGVPIAAPSANLSTKPSTTRFEHVVNDLDGKADMIIDGGDATFGVESTIINMMDDPPVLLRSGAFTIGELERYIGRITVPKGSNTVADIKGPPMAPGMKYRHYAPFKKLVVASSNELLYNVAMSSYTANYPVALLCSSEFANKISGSVRTSGVTPIVLGSEKDLYEVAKNLFNAFRELDRTDAKLGIIQTFDEDGIGLAIMNRILKASGNTVLKDLAELQTLMGG